MRSELRRTPRTLGRGARWRLAGVEQQHRETGERYAREGIAAWPEVALGFYRASVPRFVSALIAEPDRLSEALLALGEYQERSQALILLDLKLPRLDGLAVLQAIREHETTRNLPVIMMTSSDDDRDRLAAYDRHVNSYIKKPINYDEFVAAARQLGLYWIVLNLPAPVLT